MTNDNAGSLVPDDQPRGLSARGLKTALQMAARERLSADELSLARVTHPCLKTVSDEAVRLAARQPPLWEYRLYFQALADFIARETATAAAGDRFTARVDREPDYAAQSLDDLEWIQDRHQEYLELAESIDRLVNSELQVAFGRPGEPGDVGLIVGVAAKVAQVYRRFLTIRSEAQTRPTAPLLAEVMLEFSRVCDSSIAEFEDYPTRSLRTLEEALAADDGQTELVLRFDMALTADNDGFHAALDRAHRWVFGGPLSG
jgi:hypothetical protein